MRPPPSALHLRHEWIRQPLQISLTWRQERMQEGEAERLQRGFRLSSGHKKYTTANCQWLLAEAGFAIRYQTQWRRTPQMFVTTPAGTG